MTNPSTKIASLALFLGSLLTLPLASPAFASEAPIDLGTASSFSVLAQKGVANTLSTTLSKNLGLSHSGTITGFPPGVVTGHTHNKDADAVQAQTDRLSAYNAALARTTTTTFSGDNNGKIFTPGVHATASAFALTGTMTLDGGGDSQAVFVFKINAALNTAASSQIRLINSASAHDVFWQVNGAVTTGADSSFTGTLLVNGAITLGARSGLTGRALSAGTVTLADNTVVESPWV